MKRKALVKVKGKWIEQYVDQGPGRALQNHGSSVARLNRTIAPKSDSAAGNYSRDI